MSDIKDYFGMALWYAWGRMDSGEYRGQDLDLDAFEFGSIVEERRKEFVSNDKIVSFKAIQEQWTDYVKSKRRESQEQS